MFSYQCLLFAGAAGLSCVNLVPGADLAIRGVDLTVFDPTALAQAWGSWELLNFTCLENKTIVLSSEEPRFS